MPKGMLGFIPLPEVWGPATELFARLGGEEGVVWLRQLKKFLRKEACWGQEVVKKLLRYETWISLPAHTSFNVATIKEGTKGAVKIWGLGDNFKKRFGRKTEVETNAVEIRVHTLIDASRDLPIITELAEKCEITLGQFYHLLEKQGSGQEGVLLINGYANVAYIRDDEGILWAVHAYWNADRGGWSVGAYSVDDPRRWRAGRKFLSR